MTDLVTNQIIQIFDKKLAYFLLIVNLLVVVPCYCQIESPCFQGNLPKDKALKYFDEFACGHPETGNVVGSMSADMRREYQLFMNQSGRWVNSAGDYACSNGLLVIDEFGNTYCYAQNAFGEGVIAHHSSATMNKLRFAGNGSFNDGFLMKFDNVSGHYKFTAEEAENFARWLNEYGDYNFKGTSDLPPGSGFYVQNGKSYFNLDDFNELLSERPVAVLDDVSSIKSSTEVVQFVKYNGRIFKIIRIGGKILVYLSLAAEAYNAYLYGEHSYNLIDEKLRDKELPNSVEWSVKFLGTGYMTIGHVIADGSVTLFSIPFGWLWADGYIEKGSENKEKLRESLPYYLNVWDLTNDDMHDFIDDSLDLIPKAPPTTPVWNNLEPPPKPGLYREGNGYSYYGRNRYGIYKRCF